MKVIGVLLKKANVAETNAEQPPNWFLKKKIYSSHKTYQLSL